jgi:hypothetical protein
MLAGGGAGECWGAEWSRAVSRACAGAVWLVCEVVP